jgi:hypothetical protein
MNSLLRFVVFAQLIASCAFCPSHGAALFASCDKDAGDHYSACECPAQLTFNPDTSAKDRCEAVGLDRKENCFGCVCLDMVFQPKSVNDRQKSVFANLRCGQEPFGLSASTMLKSLAAPCSLPLAYNLDSLRSPQLNC